mgnify:CR=1 FL=1
MGGIQARAAGLVPAVEPDDGKTKLLDLADKAIDRRALDDEMQQHLLARGRARRSQHARSRLPARGRRMKVAIIATWVASTASMRRRPAART